MLTVIAVVFRKGRLCHLKSIYKGRGVCNTMTDDQSLGTSRHKLQLSRNQTQNISCFPTTLGQNETFFNHHIWISDVTCYLTHFAPFVTEQFVSMVLTKQPVCSNEGIVASFKHLQQGVLILTIVFFAIALLYLGICAKNHSLQIWAVEKAGIRQKKNNTCCTLHPYMTVNSAAFLPLSGEAVNCEKLSICHLAVYLPCEDSEMKLVVSATEFNSRDHCSRKVCL